MVADNGGCKDGNCGPPSGNKPEKIQTGSQTLDDLEDQPLLVGDDEVEGKNDTKTVIISLITLALSIPALIGACCWPALVIGLISGTVTAAARVTGHSISFAITGTMMVGIGAYTAYGLKRRRKWYKGKACKIYGPMICTAIAIPLILADLFRHVAQDSGIWPECPRGQLIAKGTIKTTDLPYNAETNEACRWYSGQFACEFPTQNYINNYATAYSCSKPEYTTNALCDTNAGTWATHDAAGMVWTTARMDCPSFCYTNAADAHAGTHAVPHINTKDACTKLDTSSVTHTWAGATAAQQEFFQCGCVLTKDENMGHLSTIGILFTIMCTYTGFLFLFIGTLWNANIMDKCNDIKEKWRTLRGSKKTRRTQDYTGLQNEEGPVVSLQRGSDRY